MEYISKSWGALQALRIAPECSRSALECLKHTPGFTDATAQGFHWVSLPLLSYMIGFVPIATPHTFSKMVVLPALALPITKI